MKPIYLPTMKYGMMICTAASVLATIVCMISGQYWKTVFFLCMLQFNFVGMSVVCYLDAIYEKLNPNQS